jgi:hypothetical protein
VAEEALELQRLKHLLEHLEGARWIHDAALPEPPLDLAVQRDLHTVRGGGFREHLTRIELSGTPLDVAPMGPTAARLGTRRTAVSVVAIGGGLWSRNRVDVGRSKKTGSTNRNRNRSPRGTRSDLQTTLATVTACPPPSISPSCPCGSASRPMSFTTTLGERRSSKDDDGEAAPRSRAGGTCPCRPPPSGCPA